MKWFDRWTERSTRNVAQKTSRRSFLTLVGGALVGTAAVPLLPVARGDTNNTLPDESTAIDVMLRATELLTDMRAGTRPGRVESTLKFSLGLLPTVARVRCRPLVRDLFTVTAAPDDAEHRVPFWFAQNFRVVAAVA